MENSLAENISTQTICQIANFAIFMDSTNLQNRCEAFLVATLSKNLPVQDFDLIDKDLAVKVLKKTFQNITAYT